MALNSEVHRNLKSAANEADFPFARDTTAVLLAGVEFAEAAREYPIVFIRGQDGQMRPVALLGVRNGENLFVDAQGKWDARYVPAFVGGLYDPLIDSWSSTSLIGTPEARDNHAAVWTGNEAIIWGGEVGVASLLLGEIITTSVETGGRYSPATNTWIATSITNAPDPALNSPAQRRLDWQRNVNLGR